MTTALEDTRVYIGMLIRFSDTNCTGRVVGWEEDAFYGVTRIRAYDHLTGTIRSVKPTNISRLDSGV